MSSPPNNPVPGSPEAFAQHLRTRAEQAAAASVQYAGLAERYMDLSSRLAALAEKASTSSLTELQAEVTVIESSVSDAAVLEAPPVTSPAAPVTEQGCGSAETDTMPWPGAAASGAAAAEADRPDQPDAVADREGAKSAGDGSTSESCESMESLVPARDGPSTSPRRKRSARLNTRRFAKRVRSAGMALGRRVRVKASKEDLKPQQRNALEELNRSRGSVMTSAMVVAGALFVLSLITLRLDIDAPITPIIASFAEEISEIKEPLPVEMPEEEQGEQQETETEDPEPEEVTEEPMEEPIPEPEPVEPKADAREPEVETGDVAAATEGAEDEAAVDNRSAAGRKQMLQKFGGSAASESAVQRGLEWLVSVQHPQGWWDFTRVGDAGSPGRINNPIGGTAYALMPFLAAGQTHREGSFQNQVKAGLDYLCRIGVQAPAGYDLRGVMNKGNEDEQPNEAYYVHGAATLVLCEAWGMTRDRRLRRPAEEALTFLINSQDPRGGGWRYLPQQPGSTSVTAIQVMALMAARKSGLKVPDRTLRGVMHYLDSVQVDGEGRYGYETQKKNYKGSLTAMALLCRMYLGWGRDDGDMRAGVALLDNGGPYENLYSTYFASQVMRNWGGEEWARWNKRMQNDLIATQVTEGPGAGSWKPRTGMHTRQGGRLLETSLATLTLEVYYRYQPVLPEVEAGDQPLTVE